MTIEMADTAESNIHGSGHGFEPLPESQESHRPSTKPIKEESSDEDEPIEDSQDNFFSQAQVFPFHSQPEDPIETHSAAESNEGQPTIDISGQSQSNSSLHSNSESRIKEDPKIKEESSEEPPVTREDIVAEDGSTSPSGADAALTEMKEEMKQVVGSQSTFSQEMLMDEEMLKKEEQAKRSLIALATGILDTPDKTAKHTNNADSTAVESNSQVSFSQDISVGFSQPDLLLNEQSQASTVSANNASKNSQDPLLSRVSISPAAQALMQVAQAPSATLESQDAHDEDAKLSILEQSGDMRQVIGSQSMLSQEIAQNYSQTDIAEGQGEYEGSQEYGRASSPLALDVAEKLTPAHAARKWGLVSGNEGSGLLVKQERASVESDKESSHNSVFEESMDDIDEEEDTQHAGGANLSQNLDLSGLSQEMNGLSQDSLRWAEEQTRSQGVPSVTPATSTSHSQEEKTEEDEKESQSQQSLAALGFNFLLQAAESVSREETRKSKRKKRKPSKIDDDASDEEDVKVSRKKKTIEKKTKSPVRKKAEVASPKKKKETPPKRKSDASSTDGEGQAKKKRSSAAKKPNYDLAQQAAALAQLAIKDEHVGKQLLLSMVMERQPTRTPPSSLPGPGYVLQPSFVWSHYPPLEKILREHMEEYYHLSLQKRQSASQQAFNNRLVDVVRKFAKEKYQWSIMACDKQLRDRIRCYYKTHIQNAKKRLATMLKNPMKVANSRHLIEHRDLIEQTLDNPQPDPRAVKTTAKQVGEIHNDDKKESQPHPLTLPLVAAKSPIVGNGSATTTSSMQKTSASVVARPPSAMVYLQDGKSKAAPEETTTVTAASSSVHDPVNTISKNIKKEEPLSPTPPETTSTHGVDVIKKEESRHTLESPSETISTTTAEEIKKEESTRSTTENTPEMMNAVASEVPAPVKAEAG